MVDVEARMETRVRGADERGDQRDENRTTGNIVYAAFVHTVSRNLGEWEGVAGQPAKNVGTNTYDSLADGKTTFADICQLTMKAEEPLSLLLPFQAARSAISIGEDCACGLRHNCRTNLPLMYNATPGLKSGDWVFADGFDNTTPWKSPDHSAGGIEEEFQK